MTNAELLQLYIDAEARILKGQSVRFGDRQLAMPELAEVRRERARLQAVVDRELSGGRSRFGQANFSGSDACGDGWNRC